MATARTANKSFNKKDRFADSARTTVDKLKSGEMADEVAEEARTITKRLGRSVGQVADRMEGHKINGRIGSTVDGLASRLHSAGDYLESHEPKDVGRDIGNVIRRNPLPSAAIGLGLGILVAASAFRKGSDDKAFSGSDL